MKKPCAACGKQIPAVALDCVFCNAKQSSADEAVATHELRSHMTDPTLTIKTEGGEAKPDTAPLLGVATRELDVVVARDLSEHSTSNGESPAPAQPPVTEATPSEAATQPPPSEATPQREIPSATKLTGVMQAVVLPPEYEAEARAAEEAEARADEQAAAEAAAAGAAASAAEAKAAIDDTGEVRALDDARGAADEARPFGGLARTAMGIGGAVMVALFFMHWHGVSSWRLLETLDGADFVRQLFYLTGGVVLLATALLPVPFGFRAFVGATVAATPVMVGAGGILEGWRGVVAGVAVLGLPATHLLRTHAKSSAAARALVLAAVLAVVALYVVPSSSVVPIVAVLKMIGSGGKLGPAVLGVFILIPLVFAALSLLGLMGRDLTDVGVLLSALSLLWAPVVVALRGLLIEDGTQLYVAIALLWASAIAALSLAQLLSLAARNEPPVTV